MRGRRGVALATALMLMALVLVMGLALATSSMMSLNLARQDYLETRCRMQARSGVAELIARVQHLQSNQEVQLFNPRPLDLRASFPGRTELVPGCWISFDRTVAGYSTDNTLNERPAAGWLDSGGTGTSVPPFTLELILHAEQGGHQRSYRALLRKSWPYAVYSGEGPVVLSGDPHDPQGGSHVTGRVFAAVRDDIDWRFEGQDGLRRHPRNLIFQLFTGGLQPVRDYSVPVQVGAPVEVRSGGWQISGEPDPARPAEHAMTYWVRRGLAGSTVTLPSHGNELVGSVDYSDARNQRNRQVRVYEGNRWQGRVNYREASSRQNPLRGLRPGDAQGYQAWLPPARMFRNGGVSGNYFQTPDHNVVPWPPRNPLEVYPNDEPKATYVLWGRQRLAGDPTRPSYFVVPGNLVNRVIAHGLDTLPEGYGPDLPVNEYGFELELQDCVLHVQGDVDLCDLTGRDSSIKGILGNGATLIVDGSLSVTGAQIRAGDRGMVIYAHSITLAGAGDFSGLLVASSSISIIPQAGKRVRIKGGLVTSGSSTNAQGQPGVVLHNVDVQYDPRYLKSLSSCGDYLLTAWEAL